jgi:predicted Zn-dependent protease
MLYLAQQPRTECLEAQTALQAADGYLYLGMANEALAELDSIDLEKQGDTAVLLARVRVLLHMKRWATAEALTRRCITAFPSVEEFTVQRAFALHQMKKGNEAMDVILAAPEWIRRTGIIHYNLACYEARLGDLTMARRCIDVAIQMNAAMKRNAKVDPDLQALQN